MRRLTNDNIRLGHVTKTDSTRSKWVPIKELLVYEANGLYGNTTAAVKVVSNTTSPVLYLSSTAALEVVKGLLLIELKSPIGMTADTEFQEILKMVQAAIQHELMEANGVKHNHSAGSYSCPICGNDH